MNYLLKLSAGALALSLIVTSCNNAPAEPAAPEVPASLLAGDVTLNVDTATSTVNWKGEMLGVYSHEGSIGLTNGNIVLKDGKIAGGSFTIDMKDIEPLDANYDDKDRTKANLVGHLQSPDFFDVATFPTATFMLGSGEGTMAKGKLNLRGIDGEETIQNVTITEEGDKVKLTGTVTFDRKKYNAAYDVAAKDMLLSNDIVLNVALVATK